MRAFLLLSICLLMTAAPSRAAEQSPPRIVSLSWGLTELLIELGVPPIGVADVRGYEEWVGRPALPADAIDVGLRTEPNLERIAALSPDLILASDQQKDIVQMLERIAPVLHIDAFDAKQDNAATSRQSFLQIADHLGRREFALARLEQLAIDIRKAGKEVQDHFNGEVPPVLPIRLLTPTTLRVHGANSMAMATLLEMGIDHPMPGGPTDWGFVQRRVEELSLLNDAIVLQIGPFPQEEELRSTAMWRFMPFVRNERFAVTRRVWTFGGIFSLGYLAEAFAEALMTIEPETDQ